MNTSIVMALVVILGFAHLPSQKSRPTLIHCTERVAINSLEH